MKKKIVLITMAVLFGLSATACGSGGSSSEKTDTTKKTETEEPAAETSDVANKNLQYGLTASRPTVLPGHLI